MSNKKTATSAKLKVQLPRIKISLTVSPYIYNETSHSVLSFNLNRYNKFTELHVLKSCIAPADNQIQWILPHKILNCILNAGILISKGDMTLWSVSLSARVLWILPLILCLDLTKLFFPQLNVSPYSFQATSWHPSHHSNRIVKRDKVHSSLTSKLYWTLSSTWCISSINERKLYTIWSLLFAMLTYDRE